MNTAILEEYKNNTNTRSAEGSIGQAYLKLQETGSQLLDFDTTLPVDAEGFTELLDRSEVAEFTVSSSFSNMNESFYALQEAGWQVTGMRKVASWRRDFETREFEQVPAWHFTRTN